MKSLSWKPNSHILQMREGPEARRRGLLKATQSPAGAQALGLGLLSAFYDVRSLGHREHVCLSP